jgi:carbon-monoxide dehydrogenase iron sulfur subunit
MAEVKLQRSGVIVPNPAICQGCGICELACSLYHENECGRSTSRIHLRRNPLAGEFLLETCKQCAHPECYFSCPVNAISVDVNTGARVIVESDCKGCGICAKECPFNGENTIIRHEQKKNVYVKCDLCRGREGGPVCVEVCPSGALKYLTASQR